MDKILDEISIGGRKFVLVDPGVPRYINNQLVRYFVCPVSQFDRDIPNRVEIVEETTSEIRDPESENQTESHNV